MASASPSNVLSSTCRRNELCSSESGGGSGGGGGEHGNAGLYGLRLLVVSSCLGSEGSGGLPFGAWINKDRMVSDINLESIACIQLVILDLWK